MERPPTCVDAHSGAGGGALGAPGRHPSRLPGGAPGGHPPAGGRGVRICIDSRPRSRAGASASGVGRKGRTARSGCERRARQPGAHGLGGTRLRFGLVLVAMAAGTCWKAKLTQRGRRLRSGGETEAARHRSTTPPFVCTEERVRYWTVVHVDLGSFQRRQAGHLTFAVTISATGFGTGESEVYRPSAVLLQACWHASVFLW